MKNKYRSLSSSRSAEACNFIKRETLAQMFSCEFCEIFKDTYFYKIPLVAASETFLKFNELHSE